MVSWASYLFTREGERPTKSSRYSIEHTLSGYILHFQVSCRIVHVSSGSGVLDQIDVLDQHFKQVGSPVMIGEAVYMWTLTPLKYHGAMTIVHYIE